MFDYAIVREIIVVEDEKLFALSKRKAIGFDQHHCAIEVMEAEELRYIVRCFTLKSQGVLQLKKRKNKDYNYTGKGQSL